MPRLPAVERSAQPPRVPRPQNLPDTWAEDLWWHKKMYQGACWRWWGEDVMKAVTFFTWGKLNFDTVEDLRRIHEACELADDTIRQVQRAIAVPLSQTGPLAWEWERIAEAVGLSKIECSVIRWEAQIHPDEPVANGTVAQIKRLVARQPFRNPLIEALELIQLLRLYEAAAAMLDDTLCDLLLELRQTRPDSVLCDILGVNIASSLDNRINEARQKRGAPGDPRRIPRQVLSSPRGRTAHAIL